MFKDLELNIDNIKEVIEEYFIQQGFSSVVATYDEKMSNAGKARYNVKYDNEELFIAIFIKNNDKYTIMVKEGKHQDVKSKLAQHIKDECKTEVDNKGTSYSYTDMDCADVEALLELFNTEEEEAIKSVSIVRDDDVRIINKIEGINGDKLTFTFYKTTNRVTIQGKFKETFAYVKSLLDDMIGEEEVIQTLNTNYKQNVEVSEVDRKYDEIMVYSKDKHSETARKSLLSIMYNLVVDCQKSTYTDFIFEPMRLLETHIVKVLYEDYGIKRKEPTEWKVYDNLSVFSKNWNTGEVRFYNPNHRAKVGDKEEYFLRAYKHICDFRHSLYFHGDYNFTLSQEIINHIEDIDIARKLILDTLGIIDEYYK